MNSKHVDLLKVLWRSATWPALLALRDEMLSNWKTQKATGKSEFEYLQDSFTRDGKIEGVNAILQAIEALNNKKD